MIEIDQVTYRYPRAQAPAIEDITIRFPAEHIYAILGDSGSGKTTLLKCLGRFLKPTCGTIRIDDEAITEMSEVELHRRLGIVFQRLFLFPHMTAVDNMTLAPRLVLGHSADEAATAARGMLERLGIPELADRYPSQISGGQAQRVAIARGLMLEPEHMLLDEPTAALDMRTTMEFAQWLAELQANTQFIIVTHDIPFTREIASHGVFLKNGRVHAQGQIDEIIDRV